MEKNADRLMWSLSILIVALLMGGVVITALPGFLDNFKKGADSILDYGFTDNNGRSIAYLRFTIDGEPNNYPFGTEFIFRDVNLEKADIRGTLKPGYKGVVPISGLTKGDKYILEIVNNGYDYETFRELDNISPKHEIVTIGDKMIHDVKLSTLGNIDVEENPVNPDEEPKTFELVSSQIVSSNYINSITPVKLANSPMFLMFEVDSAVESNVSNANNVYNMMKKNVKLVDDLGRNHTIEDIRYMGGEENTEKQVNEQFNSMKIMDENMSTVPDSFNITVKQQGNDKLRDITVYFAKVERGSKDGKIPVIAPIYDINGRFIRNGTIEFESGQERIIEGEYQMFFNRSEANLKEDIIITAPGGYKFITGDKKIVVPSTKLVSNNKIARLQIPIVIPE